MDEGDNTRTETAADVDEPTERPVADTVDWVESRHVADRYSIGKEIGRGGVGAVFSAFDSILQRRVVVKKLQGHRGSRASYARFHREALITARLQHPGVVPVYDRGTTADGEGFYAMKQVVGETLRERIDSAKTATQRLALLEFVQAAAETMGFAHHEGIIHRDLKPSNIMVGSHGETVIIDWGIAKAIDEESPRFHSKEATEPDWGGAGSNLTATSQVVGTPAYMPPEQAQALPVGKTADVYSLGAILYHALTSKIPFKGSSEQVLRSLAAGKRPAIERDLKDVPGELAAIINKAMAPVASQRYSDASALANDLRLYRLGSLVGAYRYSPLDVLRKWVRRHPAILLLLALGVVGGALSIWRIASERDNARRESRRASEAVRKLELERNRLVLIQARQLLLSDPGAALASLTQFAGEDASKAALIAAKAVGRGAPDVYVQAQRLPIGELRRHQDGIIALPATGEVRHYRASAFDEFEQTNEYYPGDSLGKGFIYATREEAVVDLAGTVLLASGPARETVFDIASGRHEDDDFAVVGRADGIFLVYRDNRSRRISELTAPHVTTLPNGDVAVCEGTGILSVYVAPDYDRKVSSKYSCSMDLRLAAARDGLWAGSADKSKAIFWGYGQAPREVELPSPHRFIAATQNSETAFMSAADGHVYMLTAGRVERSLGEKFAVAVPMVDVSPAGRYVAAADSRGKVLVADLETDTHRVLNCGSSPVISLLIDDSGALHAGNQHGRLLSWREPLSGLTRRTRYPSPILAVGLDGNGFGMVALREGSVRPVKNSPTRVTQKHEGFSATVSVQNGQAVSGGADGQVLVSGGEAVLRLQQGGVVRKVDWVGDSAFVGVSSNGTVVRWDLSAEGPVRSEFQPRHESDIFRSYFDHKEKRILTIDKDRNAKLWTFEGALLAEFAAHDAPLSCYVNKHAAYVAGMKGGVTKYDIETGRVTVVSPDTGKGAPAIAETSNGAILLADQKLKGLRVIDGGGAGRSWALDEGVNVVEVSPAGSLVTVALLDASVVAMDLRNDKYGVFTEHNQVVARVRFIDDGRILSGDYGGYLWEWRIPPSGWVPRSKGFEEWLLLRLAHYHGMDELRWAK